MIEKMNMAAVLCEKPFAGAFRNRNDIKVKVTHKSMTSVSELDKANNENILRSMTVIIKVRRLTIAPFNSKTEDKFWQFRVRCCCQRLIGMSGRIQPLFKTSYPTGHARGHRRETSAINHPYK